MTDLTRDPDLDIESGIEGENCNWGDGYERPSNVHIVQCPGFNHRQRLTLINTVLDVMTDTDINVSIAQSLVASSNDAMITVDKFARIESETEGDSNAGIIINGMMLTKMDDGLHLINLSGKPIFIHGLIIQ